jgi:hypothetical protein
MPEIGLWAKPTDHRLDQTRARFGDDLAGTVAFRSL